jgi:hypothetical protein
VQKRKDQGLLKMIISKSFKVLHQINKKNIKER